MTLDVSELEFFFFSYIYIYIYIQYIQSTLELTYFQINGQYGIVHEV